jgi:hypothetical protein
LTAAAMLRTWSASSQPFGLPNDLDAPRHFMPHVAARVPADEVACRRRTDFSYVGECGRADAICERLGVAPRILSMGWQKQLARCFEGRAGSAFRCIPNSSRANFELRAG